MLILANKALTERTFAIVFVDVTSRALEQIPEQQKVFNSSLISQSFVKI